MEAAEAEIIDWACWDIKRRSEDYKLYQDYYNGDHRTAFASEQWKTAFGHTFKRFRDNLCPRVVDAKADRLQIAGFTSDDAKTEDAIDEVTGEVTGERTVDPAADAASVIWKANRMDRRAGEVHVGALRDGDSAIIVWPHPEPGNPPVLYPQKAEQIAIKYDQSLPGLIEYAVKVWPAKWVKEGARVQWRLNIYYADRVERYITKEAVDGLPQDHKKFDYYVPSEQYEGNYEEYDYGVVPVFPFANNAMTAEYGRSELRDIIPIQDALNKSMADMLIAGEFHSLPQRWATGLEVEIGPDGQVKDGPIQAGSQRMWTTPNDQARFGQFEPASMQGFVTTQDSYRAEIARISGTPLHYLLLTGDFPSGAALDAAETPLNNQTADRQVSFGNAWEDVMALALKIGGLGDFATLSTVWKEIDSTQESERMQALLAKKDMGIPDQQLWSEMGYDEDQIAKFAVEKDERVARMQEQLAGGGDTPVGLPGFGE